MDTNRLRDATSPCLRQHADNPVAWWPRCEEALTLAREADKPILLSIGYSACHWCDVMAHESFEDPETAAVMNRLLVNVKVDREERPDLDNIYQSANQLLARRAGGWPLTVFLMPYDHSPFFAGTHFPPSPRHGVPAFRDLLVQVERAFRQQRGAIEALLTPGMLTARQGRPSRRSRGLPMSRHALRRTDQRYRKPMISL